MLQCGRTCGWRRKLEETHMHLIGTYRMHALRRKIFVHFTSGVMCCVGTKNAEEWQHVMHEVSKFNFENKYLGFINFRDIILT